MTTFHYYDSRFDIKYTVYVEDGHVIGAEQLVNGSSPRYLLPHEIPDTLLDIFRSKCPKPR